MADEAAPAAADAGVDCTRGPCYVCFGEDAPPSPCKCRDRFLHAECQTRLVRTSGHARCAVCTVDFPNVTVVPTHKLTPRGRRLLLAVALLVILAIVLGARWCARDTAREDRALVAIEGALEGAVAAFVFAYAVGELIFYARGRFRLLRRVANAVSA